MYEKIVSIFVSTYQVLEVPSFLMCFSLGRVSETDIVSSMITIEQQIVYSFPEHLQADILSLKEGG